MSRKYNPIKTKSIDLVNSINIVKDVLDTFNNICSTYTENELRKEEIRLKESQLSNDLIRMKLENEIEKERIESESKLELAEISERLERIKFEYKKCEKEMDMEDRALERQHELKMETLYVIKSVVDNLTKKLSNPTVKDISSIFNMIAMMTKELNKLNMDISDRAKIKDRVETIDVCIESNDKG